jgi:hypothetical protein
MGFSLARLKPYQEGQTDYYLTVHEERWTSTTKQRVSSTSLGVKRAVIEF